MKDGTALRVLALHDQGLTDEEIAERIDRDRDTVRKHRETLGVRSNRYCVSCDTRLSVSTKRRRYCSDECRPPPTAERQLQLEKHRTASRVLSELRKLKMLHADDFEEYATEAELELPWLADKIDAVRNMSDEEVVRVAASRYNLV